MLGQLYHTGVLTLVEFGRRQLSSLDRDDVNLKGDRRAIYLSPSAFALSPGPEPPEWHDEVAGSYTASSWLCGASSGAPRSIWAS